MRRAASTAAIAALLALAAASPSAAQDEARERPSPEFRPRVGRLIEGRCERQGCPWFSIEKADYIGASEKGWLMRIDARWWRSDDPKGKRGAPDDRSVHVFCSKSEPALIERAGDGFEAKMLAPLEREPGSVEAENALIFYMAACHFAVMADAREVSSLARKLSYATPAKTALAPRALKEPSEALRW
ncbi:MAG: protein of unassigned function [Hyphomicrobiales bacterium]|nr:protein of unassigned function [Hyphomicrobiales bacterium]